MEHTLFSMSIAQESCAAKTSKRCWKWTFHYLAKFRREGETMAELYKSRMQLVELSIMAMAESLCSVIVAIYGYDIREMPSWGPSPVLEAQLRSNGWCVSDTPFFQSLCPGLLLAPITILAVQYVLGRAVREEISLSVPRPSATTIAKSHLPRVSTDAYGDELRM
jgi:hypothetical protein